MSWRFGEKTREFLLREWLLTAVALGVLSTSIHLRRLPLYSRHDFEVLFLLFGFLVLIKGLERNDFFAALAVRLSEGRAAGYKLIWAVFFLSMVVTNDVALLVGVPLALKLPLERKGLLVIFLALAANAGSAFTPFGNPQNIFIYWYYGLKPLVFLKTIAPFSLGMSFVLGVISAFFFLKKAEAPKTRIVPGPGASIFVLALLVFLLVVLKILPFWVALIVVGAAVLFEPEVLRVDYTLILIFFFFFGFTDNLMAMLEFRFTDPNRVFLGAAITSQFISNVPAALLFSDFTPCWKALLWGVNVGGFGSLVSSLANLIAYRLYLKSLPEGNRFLLSFHLWGYLFFLLGMGLYFLWRSILPYF